MDKINIWIGLTSKSLAEFEKYFELNGTQCGFCIDIGENWYDEDYIGIYFNEEEDSLIRAIEETPESKLYDEIKLICMEKGITAANAMFYYTDNLEIDPNRKYNSLTYIGQFDW